MHTDGDYMEIGSLIALDNGWFLDTDTNTRFQLNEDGEPVDEMGQLLYNEEEY